MGRTLVRAFELAGIRIAVEVPSNSPWQWPAEHARFVSSPEGAQVRVGVRLGRSDKRPSDAITYRCDGGTFDIGRSGRDWVVVVRGLDGSERFAHFDESLCEGEVVVAPEAAGLYPLRHPLDELVFLHRIVRDGGLVLQGTAVLRDGRALVFLGSSPSGNAGEPADWHVPGARRLAGSRVALRASGRGVRVHATPWQPALAPDAPVTASLDAIHVIRPARAVYADRLELDTAVEELLSQALAPVHDPGSTEPLLDSAARIASAVSVVRLGMPEEKRVVPFTWGESEAALAFAPPFVA